MENSLPVQSGASQKPYLYYTTSTKNLNPNVKEKYEMSDVEKIIDYINANFPNAEMYRIKSFDGKQIFEQSFDKKECSSTNIFKKEGLAILFSNY